ncbi:MAG TPA: chromate efflux transporter [Tepidisphaeraceae bacterium]|nr:chromate efflux transporter [Tepidisphaeraceae bacterium]
MPNDENPPGPIVPRFGALAGFFLKLGTLAFGGPAAHIALMEDELVRRRKWIAPADFLDLLAVANLLPGPSSTELAIFIGYRLRGLRGLLVAGACFILPAFFLVSLLACAYVHYGKLPAVSGILYGIKPVVIAVVLQALYRLGKTALKTPELIALAALAVAAMALGAGPLEVLAGAAGVSALWLALRGRKPPMPLVALAAAAPSLATAAAVAAISLTGIFLVFLKIGSVVFGSGYVLLAYLQNDLVVHRHWLTSSQLLDSVAVGQVTPGPVFTTATFIGYVLAGPKGAAIATIGIFTPAFIFVALAGPLIRHLRRSRLVGALLDGLNAASLGLMAFVTWQLARSAIVDWPTLLIAVLAAILLLRFRLNSAWLIAAGAAAGLLRMIV